jgi:putative phosphoesterase
VITRVGVVADTHVGEHLPVLPPEVLEALAGVDLILHAGDLTDLDVLDVLGALAPVVAVRGNHDEQARLDLPRDVLVRVGGARIGLTHGHRSAAVELPAAVVSLVGGRPRLMRFESAMRRRFREVDCVVTGHLHMPIHRVVDGVLVFSPGAVYVPEQDPGFDWTGVRSRAFRHFRERLPDDARVPAVGLLEIGPAGVAARRIALRRPILAGRALIRPAG